MWQLVTNHEEAYEYYREGLLWYGNPDMGIKPAYYGDDNYWDKHAFMRNCEGIGQPNDGGFMYPNYIYLEA